MLLTFAGAGASGRRRRLPIDSTIGPMSSGAPRVCNEPRCHLARAVAGEVLFDAGSRGRYATDASIYQVEPIGVLVPKSADDVRAAIAICREQHVPVLAARRRQLAMRTDRRCRAGDRPQQASEPHRRLRPRRDDRRRRAGRGARPAERVAEAARTVVPGRRQHVGAGDARRHGRQQLLRLALDRLRQHGAQRARDRRDPVRRHRRRGSAPSARWTRAPPRIAELLRGLRAIGEREHAEIERSVPKVLRRVGGYNIDVCCPQSERPYTADGSVNFAHLLVGSEGTLAWTRELTLQARARCRRIARSASSTSRRCTRRWRARGTSSACGRRRSSWSTGR